MTRYDDFYRLIECIGAGFYTDFLEYELNDFLGCCGSDIVEDDMQEPDNYFTVEIEGIEYDIGVTSIEEDEEHGDYIYYYWVLDERELEKE